MATPTFHDRSDAGRKLVTRLAHLASASPIVVGIAPRGVPIAHEIAQVLGAPLEAWAVRQIHAPTSAEHVGALAENGHPHYTVERARDSSIPPEQLEVLAASEQRALVERAGHIRHRPRLSMRNRTVVLVDDGIATGATVRAAVRAIRQEKPHRVIVAVPVIVRGALAHVESHVDDIVWLCECDSIAGIRDAYAQYGDVDDAHVAELVDRHRHALARRPSTPPRT